jgi:hypothetical protein
VPCRGRDASQKALSMTRLVVTAQVDGDGRDAGDEVVGCIRIRSEYRVTTYLLTWNPEQWPWKRLQKDILEAEKYGFHADSWSCGVTRKIVQGDRVFLIKLGKEPPRGIMASGLVTSEDVYPGPHWNPAARKEGKSALYIDVDFDTILDPYKKIFPRERLNSSIYSRMNWEPQASGRTISDDVAEQLERDWAHFLNRPLLAKSMPIQAKVDLAENTKRVGKVGAGFGPSSESNRRVEQAAITAVRKHYESHGWKVQSVEADKRGFDLLCENGSELKHVEVKGIKGDVESFIITAREVKQAQVDQHFVLCVVRSATSQHPLLTQYTTDGFVNTFDLLPLSFRANRRD